MLICTKKEMKIAVENGYIQILSLQFPGKKKMTTSEFLNGISFSTEAKVH
jgi:methionyl-tRNA formyltransferase